MNTEYQNVQKFLDLSYYYFKISGRTAENVTPPELQEILEVINAEQVSRPEISMSLC